MNVYVFDIGSICIHVKELLRQFTFHQKTGEKLTQEQMFEVSEKLMLEQSDEIFGVPNQLRKFCMETVISGTKMKKSSVFRMQRFMYSQILCYVLER